MIQACLRSGFFTNMKIIIHTGKQFHFKFSEALTNLPDYRSKNNKNILIEVNFQLRFHKKSGTQTSLMIVFNPLRRKEMKFLMLRNHLKF